MTPPEGSAGGSGFTLIWQPAAVAGLLRLRAVDPAAAKDVRAAISALAQAPAPDSSSALGQTGLRRLRIGFARVLYQVDHADAAVQILVIGQAN